MTQDEAQRRYDYADQRMIEASRVGNDSAVIFYSGQLSILGLLLEDG